MHDINLKYFHSVAKTGSLSAASEELHIAVSAVSRQISQLEEQLQLTLFERKARGMTLTPAGELLYTYALRNDVELTNVITEMQGITNRQQQSISLACPEGMAWDFLPHIITQFRQTHPQTLFSLQVVDSAKATQLVKEGVVDAALTFSLQPEQGVQVALQVPSPVFALLSQDHPLANKEKLTVSDIAAYPLALSESGTTLNYLFEITCHLAGIKVYPALTSNAMGAIYTFTKDTPQAVALFGAQSIQRQAPKDGLILRPMTESTFVQRSLQLQVMAGRQHPESVQVFVQYLMEQLVKP